MDEPDVSCYFAEFNPTPKQLKRLTRLLRSVHKWWGVDYGDAIIQATLVVAPGDLTRLTPGATHLLARCRDRLREFKSGLDRQYDPFHKQAYRDLFSLLLDLRLIAHASSPQKLAGSTTVTDLRLLLKAKGLSDKGKKDDLVSRVVANCSSDELDRMVAGVILYRTTPAGDHALQAITDLQERMGQAFTAAVAGTMTYFEARKEPAPTLPPGVYYDDGDVRITEEDIQRALHSLSPEADRAVSLPRNPEQMTLDLETIEAIVSRIETSGDGFCILSTSPQEEAPFIQAAFLGHLGGQWRVEAKADITTLSDLGFSQGKDDFLPAKVVQQEVAAIIVETLCRVFDIVPGAQVWVEVEIEG